MTDKQAEMEEDDVRRGIMACDRAGIILRKMSFQIKIK